MGMYAKLMSRITESSLMEEELPVRYVFMMLLAIADPHGYVVGTDIAIARRLNIDVPLFKKCLCELMKEDPDSNSKEHEGRRVIDSDCERGYFLVNYVKYRDTRDEEDRRNYMREYMRKRRGAKDVSTVNSGKQRKPRLAKEEVEVQGKEKAEGDTPPKSSPERPAQAPSVASERGFGFSDWFRKQLPGDIVLSSSWRQNWAKCFDDLIRLDSRSPKEIQEVCEWARNDGFWGANFLSPMKLRQKNPSGTSYFDVFVAKMKSDKERTKKASPNTGNRENIKVPVFKAV